MKHIFHAYLILDSVVKKYILFLDETAENDGKSTTRKYMILRR